MTRINLYLSRQSRAPVYFSSRMSVDSVFLMVFGSPRLVEAAGDHADRRVDYFLGLRLGRHTLGPDRLLYFSGQVLLWFRDLVSLMHYLWTPNLR